MARGRLRAFLAAACVMQASALETAQWPPPAPVEARMRELQLAIIAPDSSAAQREAAREELSGLLKSPAGQARGRTPDEKPARPSRASIDPYPSVIAPQRMEPAPYVPPGEVARIEVIVPPKPMVEPRSGTVAAPGGRFSVDPRTGNVLHEAGAGFVDPRTGQFIPR
jgi:hypothetical protein